VTVKNEITFPEAEVKNLEIGVTKKGKPFAKGTLYLTDERGVYQASFPLFCFNEFVSALSILEQQEHSADLVGGVSVTESDGTKSEPFEPRRQKINVSGWLRNRKVDDNIWITSFLVTSIN